MDATLSPDERADRLAARQHAAITIPQARNCGLTPSQVKHRIRTRRWTLAARRVVVVTAAPRTWRQAAQVACLAGPAGAVASHLTAAALFGLATPPKVPHVTVPPAATARTPGAAAHRSPLAPEDVTQIDGIPCTTPARIVVESAALVTYDRLCDLVDDVLCRPLCRPEDIRAAMARASRRPGRKGLANLERALAPWTPGPRPQSPGEMRLVRLLLEWGFPPPERQIPILDGGGRLVAQADLGYSWAKFLLEYQGARYHGPRYLALDAARTKRVEALGWTVQLVTKHDLRQGAVRLRKLIAGALAAGACSSG